MKRNKKTKGKKEPRLSTKIENRGLFIQLLELL